MSRQIKAWRRGTKASIWLSSALALLSLGRASDSLPEPSEVLRNVLAHARASAGADERWYSYTQQTLIQNIDGADHIINQKVQVKTIRSRPIGPADATRWSGHYGVSFNQQLLDHYSFKLARRIALEGRPTLEIEFTPRNPPLPVHYPLDRLLNRAAGTLWVDEQDYELAKADLRLLEPVTLSFLGALDGLSFRLERTRSADGCWLTTRTESTLRGRRLLSPVQTRHLTEYTGYKPVRPDQLVKY